MSQGHGENPAAGPGPLEGRRTSGEDEPVAQLSEGMFAVSLKQAAGLGWIKAIDERGLNLEYLSDGYREGLWTDLAVFLPGPQVFLPQVGCRVVNDVLVAPGRNPSLFLQTRRCRLEFVRLGADDREKLEALLGGL